MKVALIGRTRAMLRTGRILLARGHEITLVATARSEPYYGVAEEEFETFANEVGAAYIFGVKINTPEALNIMQASSAGVAISINWPNVLGAEVCSTFPHGIINAHAGDLPRYRGNACPNWAILNGESRIGLCLHEMEARKLDSGPVLLREYFSLSPDTYIEDVYEWIEQRVPEMFVAAVNGLEDGSIKAVPQSSVTTDWLRCYPRRAEDAKIDWKEDAEHIYRLIRASSRPLNGAFSFVEGKYRIIIWRAEIFKHPGNFCAVPGQILLKRDGNIVVACGNGAILMTEFETECAEAIPLLKSLRSRLL